MLINQHAQISSSRQAYFYKKIKTYIFLFKSYLFIVGNLIQF